MHLTFISKYSFERTAGGHITSSGASARLRVTEPAIVLHRLGHSVRLKTVSPGFSDFVVDFREDNVVVVSKIIDPEILHKLSALAEGGLPVVVDICDNRINHPIVGSALRRLISASKGAFCNTMEMARVVNEAVPGKRVWVLPEPVEGALLPRKPLPVEGPLRLLWFGHQDGLPQLQRAYPLLCQLAQERPMSLSVVCGVTPDTIRWVSQTNDAAESAIPISFVPWGVRALREACRTSDIAVLPGSDEEFWRTKSPNRLLQALWFGLRVAAHPFPSYTAYGAHCVLDADPAAALARAIEAHPATDVHKILARECSSLAVGQKWAVALQQVCAAWA